MYNSGIVSQVPTNQKQNTCQKDLVRQASENLPTGKPVKP